MIDIDGSIITGGGQVLRYALAFSSYTNKPFRIFNIRAKRPKPGLSYQHLEAVKAMQVLCNASVEGAFLGSKTIVFVPYGFSPKPLSFDIGTAGSITLFLQALMLPAMHHKKTSYTVIGGTDVRWSPPVDYVRGVIIPSLNHFGDFKLEVERRGFYPSGGGVVKATFGMSRSVKPFVAVERGVLHHISCVCHASRSLLQSSVCEDIERNIRVLLADLNVPLKFFNSYSNTKDDGYSVVLYATHTLTEPRSLMGVSLLSDEAVSTVDAASKVSEKLRLLLEGPGVIDEHLCDHLIPFMALHGGEVITSKVSNHIMAGIRVAERFTSARFHIDGKRISVSRPA